MKIRSSIKLCVTAVVIMLTMSSCFNGGIDEDYAKYIRSNTYRKDLYNFFYAGALQQAMESLMLHACSNEFTLTKNDTVNFGDRKLAYWRDYAIIMGTIEEHQDEFKESYERLHDMKVFETATPTLDEDADDNENENDNEDENDNESKSKKSKKNKRRADADGGSGVGLMSLVATPAHAAGPAQKALFAQAFYEFCGITSDLARESRKTIITVAAKLSDDDRRVLFNSLDKHERQGETDYKTWWNNLADGKYDVRAHRIYRTLIAANDSPAKTNYLSVADDMGILTEKEFCSKAGRAITAGAKLYVECVNKVVGGVAGSKTVYYGNMAKGQNIKGTVLSYDGVYGTLDNVNNTVEQVRSIANLNLKMKDAQEYTTNTLKNIVSDELSNVYIDLGKAGRIELDGQLGGAEFVEYGQILYSEVKKRIDSRSDPKLTWGTDAERMAQIKIVDKDGKPTGMIIARDKETGAIYAVKSDKFDGKTSIRVPAGEYDVTALDKQGDKHTVTGVELSEGEKKEIEAKKNEQEIVQKLIKMHEQDGEDEFQKWWKGFKKRRAEKKAKEEKEAKEKEKEKGKKDKDDDDDDDDDEDEKSEKTEKADKAEKKEKADDSKKAEKNEKAGKAENTDKADKPAAPTTFDIVGKWKIADVKVSGTLANEVPENDIRGHIQEFRSNGTYSISGKGGGRYRLSGDVLTLDGQACRIKRLAPNRMTITYNEVYYEGGRKQNLQCVLIMVKM